MKTKVQRLEAKLAKLEKEKTRFQKESIRFQKESIRFQKESIRFQKENTKLKERLSQEDALWGTELGQDRHNTTMPIRLLHILETLESIILDDNLLYTLTRNHKDVFDDTLNDLSSLVKESNDMPHFRDDSDRKEDSGNQCKLYMRHFLLLCEIRKAHNWTQDALAAFFGIDQSTVSRYLQLGNTYNDKLYTVTPDNMTRYISTIKSTEELREILPGKDGGEITIDGTLVQTTRPEDKDERKKQYSGKKKMFAISTTALINKDNYIIGTSDSREGSCHDGIVLTEGMPDFGKWTDRMIDGKRIPKDFRIRLNLDGVYAGIQNYLLGVNARIPYKKPKNGELTKTQKKFNKAHSRRRVPVENTFAHVKNWKRIAGRYDGTAEEFNVEFNGICGMYNKRKMWKDGTYHYWKNKILNIL